MSGQGDRELVARAKAGDRAAMDELLRGHYDRIYAICRRITGNDADAADATQDALVAIVRGLERFDGRSKFSTWSYRVATNCCLDELRRRKRRPVPSSSDDSDDWRPESADPVTSTFDDEFVQRDELGAALDTLPDQFRIPVILRDCGGLDYAEIAQALDIPPGTVRSRIARGRSKLAELLTAGNHQTLPERQNEQP